MGIGIMNAIHIGMDSGGGASEPALPTGTLQAVSESATGSFAGTVTSAAFDPLAWRDLLTGAGLTVQLYLQGDVGISETTGTLTAWADQSGNARNGTAVDAPAFNATGLNGRGTVLYDGSNDGLDIAWNPPAPGTTPSCHYLVARARSWTTGDRLFGGSTTTHRVTQTSSSPNVQVGNGTLSGELLAMTVDTWFRVIVYLNNSTNGTTGDYFQVGANGGARGTAFGNGDATGFSQAMIDGGASFGNFEIALHAVTSADIKSVGGLLTALDALTTHATQGYGSGVQV